MLILYKPSFKSLKMQSPFLAIIFERLLCVYYRPCEQEAKMHKTKIFQKLPVISDSIQLKRPFPCTVVEVGRKGPGKPGRNSIDLPWNEPLLYSSQRRFIEFGTRPSLHGLRYPVMEGYLQLSLQFEGFCLHLELVGNSYSPNVALVFSQEVKLKNPELPSLHHSRESFPQACSHCSLFTQQNP